MERAATFLELSDFQFWPSAGGLDDQDMFLIEDVMTFLDLKRYARWLNSADDETEERDPDKLHDAGVATESFD